MSTEYLTTREVAALLRIKERKVYDLAASGSLPCSKAIGKLLFPKQQVIDWLNTNSGSTVASVDPRPAVFLGSHDPLLDWAIRESQSGLAVFFDGSSDGLQRFAERRGVATGTHIYHAATDSWNVHAVELHCAAQPAVLLEWAKRRRGIMVNPAVSLRIKSLTDLAGMKVVPRQHGAGAQTLFEHLLGADGVSEESFTYTDAARSENDLAQIIRDGDADAGFGLECVAKAYNLDFIFLLEERYDVLVDRVSYFDAPMQTLLTFCRSELFNKRADQLLGYDVSMLGRVIGEG